MDVRLLGPVEASVDGHVVAVGAGKPRALLAMLALHAGTAVSSARLIEGLWGDAPPATAVKLVQLHVSQLRKAMARAGDGKQIVTRGHAYELRLSPEELDVTRVERLVAGGRPREALALWRGPPLDDVAGEPFAAAEIRRLEELRLTAVELAIERDLEVGRHRDVVGELEALVLDEPLRERLHGQRMLALYRSGRQADALEAYREARAALVEQIGVEPGPELRRLHEAILRQDAALERPATEPLALPPELDTSTPLIGREDVLRELRDQWRAARDGSGRLVLIAGARGIGKTRLAAELAAEVHRDGGAVRYVAGPQAMAVARAERRPALLVLDDADRGDQPPRAALAELAGELAERPLLAVALIEDAASAIGLDPAATLTLAPLGAEGVRAVARLHAGARADAEIPVERLAGESGGIPEQLHRAAAGWARTLSVRRLSETADRIAVERPLLRATEDDLAANIVGLHVARERGHLGGLPADDVVCPFKGLASFGVDDAEFFFGRERLVAETVAKLIGSPLTGLVGPSGSGKSSTLRAGLLAALAAGVLPGSERWSLALLRPGERPLEALEQATSECPADGRLIVAVDQFEEVFTACRDEGERAAFADALTARALDPRRPALVLIAVRADFYGRCASYPELARQLGANHMLVGPMQRDELRRAIELPARRAGLEVEPELVDALLGDVEGEPGALPLLSTALLELWQHRDGRRLRMAAYERAGGVHGAVARLAERAYEQLDQGRRDVARRILLRLAGAGEGDTVVRRRVPLDELDGEGVPDVLAVLADERLVTIGEGEVEVAHEALLREWPRLRGWLEEDEHGRRLQLLLRDAARQWDAAGRDPGELYRGARLAAVLDWSSAHADALNRTERAFVTESWAASQRSQRRLRAVLAGVAALLAVAVVAGIVALEQRGDARTEAIEADAQRLGARALLEDDLDRSLLLARQGVALDDTRQTRGNLLAALVRSPAVTGVLRGDGDRLLGVDLSPDQRTLAFIDNGGALSFVDTRTRGPVGPSVTVGGHVGTIIDGQIRLDHLRFSPDGARLAVGGGEPVVLDSRTHRVLARLRFAFDGFIYELRFSPDGRTLYAAIALPSASASIIRRYDARTGEPLGSIRRVGDGLVTLMISRDGRRLLVTTGTEVVIHDARTLSPLQRWPIPAEEAAVSPDDRTLVAGDIDGSVRFLDLGTGEVTVASGRHERGVVRAAFSPDGRVAITAGDDGQMIVWDVERASVRETFEGHAGQISGMAIGRDGRTLYSSSLDGSVLIWDLAGTQRLGRPFSVGPDNPEGPRYALSSDGRVLAVGQADGSVTLTDMATLRRISRFPVVPRGPVRGMGFVPGGRLLFVGGEHGFASLVDADRGRIVKRLRGHRERVFTPSFSADGRIMATASGFTTVRVWSLPTGRALGRPLHTTGRPIGHIALSPDGRTLAVTRPPDGGVDIRDVPTLRRRTTLAESETIWDLVHFTPDGRRILAGSWKGWAQLWSTETWKPASRRFIAHAGRVESSSLSANGRTLATGGPDGTIRLWDLRTQQPIGAPLPGVPNRQVAPQFTPDGGHLLVIYGDQGRAFHWDVRPSTWARQACAVAGRTLTPSEWRDALPDRDYAPACTS